MFENWGWDKSKLFKNLALSQRFALCLVLKISKGFKQIGQNALCIIYPSRLNPYNLF